MRKYVLEKRFGLVAAGALTAAAACAPDFSTTRSQTPTTTVGTEVYGVLCDRVGAQALPEDLTGGSFTALCHPTSSGMWATTVNLGALPPITVNLKDANGKPVSISTALDARTHGVARIEALAQDRAKLITALDATFPNVRIPIRNTSNPNAALTCQTSPTETDSLPSQLADLLGRFTKLYDDGTIPQSTESFARVMAAFGAQTDAQAAYARFHARQGYRPIDVALGAARPVLAYPNLRDFANATLDMLSSTGSPFAPGPGSANPQFEAMLAASYQELRTVTLGTPLPLLKVGGTDPVGRGVLSRPRDNLEFMRQIFFAQDPAFGGGPSQFIVQRDPRGYALVPLVSGAVPAPFVDMDGDGLADVDALGQFMTTGPPAPTPFFSLDGPAAPASDMYGRALTSASGGLYYGYVDTSHVYAASLLSDLDAFVDPNQSDAHETLLSAIQGAYVLMGSRATAIKQYAPDPSISAEWGLTHTGPAPAGTGTMPVSFSYNGFNGSTSPMLDLVYALANVAADRTNDDVLAYTQALLAQDVGNVARLAGVGLAMQANAKSHTEAHIPAQSTFWDEMIDVTVQIEQEPGLLEDILLALGDDRSLGIPPAFGAYNNYNDAITYDTNHLNGPAFNRTTGDGSPPKVPVNRSMPDTGANRSDFQRFTALIHDTDGLTVCNKANATVIAQGLPIVGSLTLPISLVWGYSSWPECAIFKIDNAAAFYLDSIVGKSTPPGNGVFTGILYLRDDTLRNGINIPLVGSVGTATVGLMEDSSGLTGPWTGGTGVWASVGAFWDGTSSTTLRPTPYFLDRQLFFDQAHDSTTPSGPNYLTNQFLSALIGQQVGTTVCPERIIVDPCASPSSNCFDAPDKSPDGLVHGLRACPDGDWLIQRDADTIFTWEDEGFYQAMTPILTAFTNHNREDLFIALMETLDRHWADNKGSASECLLSVDPSAKYKNCTQDGLVTYEPLLVQQYTSDLIPALHDLVKNGLSPTSPSALLVPHCDAIDPVTHACTPSQVSGITVMANTIRSLFDPTIAAAAGLKDRHGNVTAVRNDGTTNPQVTRIYLILEALNGIDAAFAAYAAKNPMDAGRQTVWRSARSQIVDQFFTINGTTTSSSFADASIPRVLPDVIGALREQLVAHCPSSFNAPYPPCAWAGQDLTSHMEETVDGPLFAAAMDLTDAIRQNPSGRIQLEQLLTYLLDTASENEARAITLGAANDMFQVLEDDANLVPFYHVLAEAARPSVLDSHGNPVQKGVADAQMGLLSRIAARGLTGPAGKQVEDCGVELDPNQVIATSLKNLVTPMALPGGKAGQTPLDVMLDVVDDVNRAAPLNAAELAAGDYQSIATNLTEFLTDKQRGLEQFYEVVRLGTQ